MANTVHFRRALCPAGADIGFESQLDVYLRDTDQTASSTLSLAKITTANVGVVDGMLVADFHLNDTMFGQPEEIIVSDLIAGASPESGSGQSTSVQLNAMVVMRRWPVPSP